MLSRRRLRTALRQLPEVPSSICKTPEPFNLFTDPNSKEMTFNWEFPFLKIAEIFLKSLCDKMGSHFFAKNQDLQEKINSHYG